MCPRQEGGRATRAAVLLWGSSESASPALECLGGASEHGGMSPRSPEHLVSPWVRLPQGQGPDCTAVLIAGVNGFDLVFVVTEFPLQD